LGTFWDGPDGLDLVQIRDGIAAEMASIITDTDDTLPEGWFGGLTELASYTINWEGSPLDRLAGLKQGYSESNPCCKIPLTYDPQPVTASTDPPPFDWDVYNGFKRPVSKTTGKPTK
jgi:hypothetical protein